MSALAIPVLLGLMQQCAPGHAPNTVLAIAKTEAPQLDPLWVGDNTTRSSQRFETPQAAARAARGLIAAGHSVDLGLMQINNQNFGWLNMAIEDAFDPCKSIKGAVQVLLSRYDGGGTVAEQQAALLRAISAYNTGSPERGFKNGYVMRVQANAARLIPALLVGPQAGSGAAAPAPVSSDDVARPIPPRQSAVGLLDGLRPSAPQKPSNSDQLVDGLHPN